MNIIEVSQSEYQKLNIKPISVFDTVDFIRLVESKVAKVKYLVFDDGKRRFGLIVGISSCGELRAPFSAPYSCLTPISENNKIKSYNEACVELVKYAKKNGLKKIRLTLPPTIYAEDHISKLYNSLYVSKFKIAGCDLNYQYDLSLFTDKYESDLQLKPRQKLRSAIKNELSFEKTSDIEVAYEVIKKNRKSKGYPLWMSFDDVKKTIEVIDTDFFLVMDDQGDPVAASMVYYITKNKVQVIYWGNIEGSNNLKSMNFLAYNIFKYYSGKNIDFFDVGPSTEFSIPNYGLCDFKQSIGCQTSSKMTFELEL